MSAPAPSPVRLVIIDDSPLIRAGLRTVLEGYEDVRIVAEAGNAADGLAAVTKHRPEVVLLDLRLPDRPGLAACRDIVQRVPAARVLVLTSSTDERHMHEAIAVGAAGYLLKETDGASLVAAVRRAAAGHSVLDPSLADQLLNLMKRPPGAAPSDRMALLSPQERRVLALLADGLTNKGIGDQLGLTEKTVKNYLSNIFDKLQISRRAQAAAFYVKAHRERGD